MELMKSARGLAFSVAGVAVAVFGVSLLWAGLVPNYSKSPTAELGILIAAVGMILSLVAASMIRENP